MISFRTQICNVLILWLTAFALQEVHGQEWPPPRVDVMKIDQSLLAQSRLGGLCVDRLGCIYVANFAEAVWRIDPRGMATKLTDGLYGSSGNAIDPKGNLYQANFFNHSIIKIDRFGNISSYREEGLNGPVGLAIDSKSNMYVCNFNENNILKISPDQNLSVMAEGDLFDGPNGIVVSAEDELFVVNFNNNDVISISADGIATVFATVDGVDGNAHITSFQKNLYVSKIKSNQIFEINQNGEVRLLAGTGKSAIEPGSGTAASFSAPNGIAADPTTGKLYVNNVHGSWNSGENTTIKISKIQLTTLDKHLTELLDAGNISAAEAAFSSYIKDPFHQGENLGPTLGRMGWQFMTKRKVPEAIRVFEWNIEIYPDRWRGYFYLGDVHKIIGQYEQAKKYYEMALEKDPGNSVLKKRLLDL